MLFMECLNNTVVECLNNFYAISRQKVNLHKSTICFSNGVSNVLAKEISKVAGIPIPSQRIWVVTWEHCPFMEELLLLFGKYAIPHRFDVGFASFFHPIKRATPPLLKSHFFPPLKAICSITQLFWVFTFCLNFLGN